MSQIWRLLIYDHNMSIHGHSHVGLILLTSEIAIQYMGIKGSPTITDASSPIQYMELMPLTPYMGCHKTGSDVTLTVDNKAVDMTTGIVGVTEC